MLPKKLKIIVRGFSKSGFKGANANISLANRAEEKHFHDEYSCALLANGECPVCRLDRDELLNLNHVVSSSEQTNENYCKYIAMKLISNKPEDARFLEHNPNDGRHRDCIADILQSKDINVQIVVK